MKPNLARCLERLDWADKKLDGLDTEMRAFFRRFKDSETHNMFQNPDAKAEYSIYRLVVRESIPVSEWALFVSEIAHHARSCLDNLIYAMTIAFTKNPDPAVLASAGFPLVPDSATFCRREKKTSNPAWVSGIRKIQGTDPNGWAVVESFQPYPGRTGIPTELLKLDKFWNADKHRLPPIVGTVANLSSLSIEGSSGIGPQLEIFINPLLPFENGAVVAGYRIPKDGSKVVMKADLSLQVLFADGSDPWSGRSIPAFLKPCLEAVRQTALALEPYF